MFGFTRGVVCETCKHVVSKKDAQRVAVSSYNMWQCAWQPTPDIWYCPDHKVPYNILRKGHRVDTYIRTWVEVDIIGDLVDTAAHVCDCNKVESTVTLI